MKMKNLIIPLLVVCFGPVSTSEAQMVKGRQIVRAELMTDASDFSKPFTVAIHFVIEPDWYTYWRNPGDSGLPIEVEWVLPGGWSADEIKFPVPEKFTHDNLITYGYKKEVVLFATINPAGSARQPLKAKLNWLVCKESCVRGDAVVNLDLKNIDGEKRAEASGIMQQYRQRLPQPRASGSIVFEKASAEMAGVGLRIRIPFKAASDLEFVDFYPESVKGILMDFSSIRLEGEQLVFKGTPEGTGTGDIYLRGLFISADGKGYESSVPIKFSDME